MARNQSPILNWTQYLAIRGVTSFLQSFDVETNLATAAGVGSLYFASSAARRARIEHGIALSFPEWSAARVSEVAERSVQHMFQLAMVDALAAPRLITPASWTDHIELGDLGNVLDRLISGEPMILFTGHCGNWELLGMSLAVLGYRIAALARPIDNPLINRWILGLREARGMRIITKWGATPVIEDILEGGGRVGFIADQNAGQMGIFAPFFGRFASTYKSIGLLALRHRVPVVAGFARRMDGTMRYELSCPDIITPEDWDDQEDPLFYITARMNHAMETMIRAAPEQYLWVHRRWKSRPRHERLGKPVPARLRAKLEALPWMTDAELERIIRISEDPDHWEAR